jgi:hypothetical protein
LVLGFVSAGLSWHSIAALGGEKKGEKKDIGLPAPAAAYKSAVPWPHHGKRRKASPEEIEQWLKDLGNSAFRTREAASKALLEVGRPALKGLAEAARTGDLEVRRRADQLRERIETAEALAPTVIDIKVKDTPLPAVVAAISKQSRLKLELVPQQGTVRQQLDRKRISLDLNSVPFWEGLDALCREGNLVPVMSGVTTLQLQVAEGGKVYHPPTGYTGPFRMRITGMNYYRNVNLASAVPGQAFGALAGPHRTETLTVTMDLIAEPHLNIMSMGNPSINEATDEAGEALAIGGGGVTNAFYGNPNVAPGASIQPRQTQFNLRPSTKPAGKLTVLKGNLPIEIIAQRRPLIKVDDIMAGKARVIKGEGDLMLAILQVQDHGGGRGGNIRFLLSGAGVPIANPNMGFNPNNNEVQQRFELTDAQGHRINANINVNFNFNNNPNADRSVEGNIYFNSGPNEGPAARLTYNNNRTIRTLVPFEFGAVPMP